MEDYLPLYDRLGSQPHPIYTKPNGLVTADDVAQRLSAHIAGKTVLVTGCGLASLAQHIVWTIAAHAPAQLIICGRSDVRLRLLAANVRKRNPGIDVRHEVFDLADLAQVRTAAARINAAEKAVDVIICSAGIMLHPLRRTVDGIESQFGINAVAHFVLVNMLLSRMIENGGGRIVTTSSGAHIFGGIRWEDPNYEKEDEYHKAAAYAASKTADILFAAALARRYGDKGIVATSVDIGGGCAETNLGAHIPDEELAAYIDITPRTKAEASSSQLTGAFDPAMNDHNGTFLLFNSPLQPTVEHAKGQANEDRFWEVCENLAKQQFRHGEVGSSV